MRTPHTRTTGTAVRLLLALLLLAATAACGTGTATTGTTLTVLVPWEDQSELNAFKQVLGRFQDEYHITVRPTPTRALDQVLQTEVQRGDPPDLAVIPTPGTLSHYARQNSLTPLDGLTDHSVARSLSTELRQRFGPQWYTLIEAGTQHPYAVVVKASVKSLLWYDPRRLGQSVPGTSSQLTDLDGTLSRQRGTPWCLALADPPNSGWPGTDWIEDILLHQSGPRVYAQWVNGQLAWDSQPVVSAWQTWGRLAGDPAKVYGGASGALLTRYSDGDLPLFDRAGGCSLAHGALVPNGNGTPRLRPGHDYDFFPFPPNDAAAKPSYEVAGDLLTVFRDSSAADRFLSFMASTEAQRIWPQNQPDQAFSADREVTGQLRSTYAGDRVAARIDQMLTSPDATLCFDASDSMPETMAAAFDRAVLAYLQNPDQLPALLGQLDQVRAGAYSTDHPSFTCGT
jgi:alpha-glucoside transport system substrate-binding protein